MGQAPDLALRPLLLLGLIGGTAIFASTSIGSRAVALYGLSALGALGVAGVLLSRQMGRSLALLLPSSVRRWVTAAFGLVLLSAVSDQQPDRRRPARRARYSAIRRYL
jgi:hypothetical protein